MKVIIDGVEKEFITSIEKNEIETNDIDFNDTIEIEPIKNKLDKTLEIDLGDNNE